MRNLICASVGVMILAGVFAGFTEATRPEPQEDQAGNPPVGKTAPSPIQGFMRLKLQASNHILEGLVVDDMKKVNTGARMLLEMSVEEHWRASNDMLYLQHSRTFRDSVKKLQEKASKNSLDGAALAWMDVTLNCIQCHEWVRNVLIADVDLDLKPFNLKGLAQ
jgi:hypothetical protein